MVVNDHQAIARMTTQARPRPITIRRQRPPRRVPRDTRAARAGAWLIQHRRWIPVPFVAVALAAHGRPALADWAVGIVLMAAAASIRLAGIAAMSAACGGASATDRLATHGIYAWTRNPIHLANGLGVLGLVVASGAHWLGPITAILLGTAYSLIVSREEAVLEATFGDRYDSYRHRTPRWLPRPPRACLAGDHRWRAALLADRAILVPFAVTLAALLVLQLSS